MTGKKTDKKERDTIMKKYLIQGNSTGMHQYRADLHHHTVKSDGRLTPEQTKELYMQRGYAIVAFTDHADYFVHNDLTDDHFLALNGVELDVEPDPEPHWKANHICWVALTPDIREDTIWNLFPNIDPSKAPAGYGNSPRPFTAENVNRLIRLGQDSGFFVTYNHPTWSRETADDYLRYEGMNAMEVVNGEPDQYDEENGAAYDDLLRAGKRLYAVAADDSHGGCVDPAKFGGNVMIFAPELKYTVITDALVKGHFYAPHDWNAPLIDEMIWEDGKIMLKTGPAKEVAWFTDKETGLLTADEGKLKTEWTLEIPEGLYFRLEIKAENGSRTYTNAYFTDELYL